MTAPRPFIIPVFIPHKGCPHQCVFCNQTVITGADGNTDPRRIRAFIDRYLGYRSDRRGQVQISFYGGTFLGLSPDLIRLLTDLAQDYVDRGLVHSLRCSTRPDTVTEETLDRLADVPLNTVELGVQSMDDGVLARSRRGHTAEDTERAVALLRSRNKEIGLQLMVGLPGDDRTACLAGARRMADLAPDFVRIYPTLVLRHSPLATLYRSGDYRPLSLDESVSLVKELYLLFRSRGIPVIRMGLQATEGLDRDEDRLAGPYHPAFGHLVASAVFLDLARALLGTRTSPANRAPVFFVHPKNISKLRGLKNQNLHVLKAEFNLTDLTVLGDESLDDDSLNTDQRTMTMAELGRAPGEASEWIL
ncbi:radical SAM protein [Desulfatiferula olefinivorans]